jgi:hypothetical protein
MSFFSSAFLKLCTLVCLLSFGSGLCAKPEKKPNLQTVLTELSKASKTSLDTADAIDLVDHVEKWEKLITVADVFSGFISAQIESAATKIEDFKKKSRANPSKARLYGSLVGHTKEQVEQLKQIKSAIDLGAGRLKNQVKRIRSNPEAAEILEAKARQRQILNKVEQLNKGVVSPELEKVLREAE